MISISSIAQNNVGIGTTNPHASAVLDLTASDKGLLIPRVNLVALNNGTAPINSPATGLLVYNQGGSVAVGFYYWDGDEWILVGSGGSVAGCTTLDEAYDCNGAGAGRQINAQAGSVEITLPSSGTGDSGLDVISEKGTVGAPTASIQAVNSQYGAGLIAEVSNGNNPYSAIIGTSLSTLTTGDLSSGVSGYHDGNGFGVGVWGETSTNNTGGASYGVYGVSSGNGNGFGGYFYSNKYPGLYAATNGGASIPAFQVASTGANPLNPAQLSVGSVQFNCGNSGYDYGNNVMFNNVAGEVTIAPDMGEYGSLGASGIEWYYLYYYNASQASRRDLKRNITYFDENISDMIMADIENMKPALYKYKIENDEIVAGKEIKTRYNMHLGFIVDETPDYVQDNAFNGVDIYALSSMAIIGVQHNRKSIIKIEEKLENLSSQVNDFGIATLNGKEVRVKYNKDFNGIIPVVSITPNKSVGNYYISSQDANGFVLSVENTENFQFNWIAMAVVPIQETNIVNSASIDPVLMSQLRVDENKKQQIRTLLTKTQETSLKLVGTGLEAGKPKRFVPAD